MIICGLPVSVCQHDCAVSPTVIFVVDYSYNQKADVLQGMSLFGDLFHSGDDGVVTSLSLLPDRKSAVQVDNLGPAFKDLSILAGRGVAVSTFFKTSYTQNYVFV